MANPTFDKEITAVLIIDPYNDFISEGRKVRNCINAVAAMDAEALYRKIR